MDFFHWLSLLCFQTQHNLNILTKKVLVCQFLTKDGDNVNDSLFSTCFFRFFVVQGNLLHVYIMTTFLQSSSILNAKIGHPDGERWYFDVYKIVWKYKLWLSTVRNIANFVVVCFDACVSKHRTFPKSNELPQKKSFFRITSHFFMVGRKEYAWLLGGSYIRKVWEAMVYPIKLFFFSYE